MRVALVHDWLTGMRGGERVLEGLLDLYPEAEIFTLVHVPGSVSPRIEARPIHVPWPGRTRLAGRYYRYGLPLMPASVSRIDLAGFDLVLSSSHCVAKGVRTPGGVPHICYCHTPMRYIWDQYDAYFGPGRAPPHVRAAMAIAAPRLRAWDRRTAGRVTAFIANSHHVRERIRRCYERDATVVHPPVDIDRFEPGPRDDLYVCLGALVPYKRIDVVVEAFNRLGRRLLVIGEGGERRRLEALAGPTVELTGRLSDERVAALLGRARALVHAGVEDFGITLVEAQAAGTPVIAYAAGGALETVVDARTDDAGATGILFDRQTPAAVADAVRRLDGCELSRRALQENAGRFGADRFRREIRRTVDRALAPATP